jgi:hypothetical protein
MRTIGKLTTLLLLGVAAAAAAVGVKSIPDLQRYLRMREM